MKLVGCLLIFVGMSGMGVYASRQLERRLKQLNSLRWLLVYISREIDYQLTPLSETMAVAAKKADKPWSLLFENLGQVLNETTSFKTEIDVLLEREIKKIEIYHPWKKDLVILVNLVKRLGQLDKTMQVAQLKLAEEEVIQAQNEALDEYKRKSQLYKTLGVCMGVLGVIIFI